MLITYLCGHSGEVELSQDDIKFVQKLQTMKSNLCPECDKLYGAIVIGLPELTGSEKQIAWATKIRTEQLAEFNEILRGVKAHVIKNFPDKIELVNEAYREAISGITNAEWWIENRSYTFALKKEFDKAMEKRW